MFFGFFLKNVIKFNRSTDIEDFVYVPSEENPNINYHKLLTTRYDEDLKRIEKQVSCLRTSFKILVKVILLGSSVFFHILQTHTKITLCFDDTMKLDKLHISGDQKEVAKAVEEVTFYGFFYSMYAN